MSSTLFFFYLYVGKCNVRYVEISLTLNIHTCKQRLAKKSGSPPKYQDVKKNLQNYMGPTEYKKWKTWEEKIAFYNNPHK